MLYTFDSYHADGTRFDTCVRPASIPAKYSEGDYVLVTHNILKDTYKARSVEDVQKVLAHNFTIDAKHYAKLPLDQFGLKSEVNNLMSSDEFYQDRIQFSNYETDYKRNTMARKKEVERDQINPSHYQNYFQDLQWIEAMQYLPRFRNPENFKAAIELMIRNYLDRLGQKDPEAQDMSKCVWYSQFLLAYIKNGNKPIRIADISPVLMK